MDLRNVLALAQQQQSIPGLLSMLRGGDPQGGGGGGGGGGGAIQQGPTQRGAAPQGVGRGGDTSQLQMAQSAMDGGGGTSYAPDWIKNTGGVDTSQGYGGIGQLGKEYDPANWGPAPPPGMAGKGPWGADDPNGKFWSNGGILDDRANTMNWRLLGDVPGNYMQNGTLISAAKRYYDLHRPISDPITAGSFRPAPQFGPGMYWSTTGELGYPGQLSNFATMWGAGGPGSG